MKFNSPENPIEKIEFIINSLIDFSNKNEFDFTIYNEFAKASSKTFNRYFSQIENETDKEKIISELKTNFHFTVIDIVKSMDVSAKIHNPEPEVTYYIGQPIPDTRIRGYENNYKQLIELFLNSAEFEVTPPTETAPGIDLSNSKTKDYKDTIWFKTGIPLATGEAFELYRKYENNKGVFEIINDKFGEKKSDRTFFSSTINDLKPKASFDVKGKRLPDEKFNKNTFADKIKLQILHKHLTENNMNFGSEFLEKYNQIEPE